MTLLGVDPHKSTHTATAVDPVANQQAGSLRIDANLAHYRRHLTWGRRWPRPQVKWVVKNATVSAATWPSGSSPAARLSNHARRPHAGRTVAELARTARMSRSAFAAAFHAKAGETPLSYLTSWRLYRAKTLLRDTR